MRYILIIFLLVSPLVSAEIKSYELTDIRNSKKYTLVVKEDLVNEEMRLYVNYRHNIIDSLLVPFMKQIERVSEFQEKFLKVEFSRGGGSGVLMHFTNIFCVANSKIVTSLSQISKIYSHINYIPKYDSIKGVKYHEDYSISYNLLRSRREYSIKLNESYFLKSVFESDNNEKWTNHPNLKFNNEQLIFYSRKREVKGHFQIYYLNKSEESKELNGEFWAIELKKFTYLRIASKWFNIDGDKLFEL